MTKRRIYTLTSLYALLMLLILLGTVSYLLLSLKAAKEQYQAPPSDTPTLDLSDDPKDSLDVSKPSDDPDDENYSAPTDSEPLSDERWIVKEYMGQIGIFTVDGHLEQLLDTYVKTLPKADRDLLGEGFEVQSKEALYDIIQDYSN